MIFLFIWAVMFKVCDYLLGSVLSTKKNKVNSYIKFKDLADGGNNGEKVFSYLMMAGLSCFLSFILYAIFIS